MPARNRRTLYAIAGAIAICLVALGLARGAIERTLVATIASNATGAVVTVGDAEFGLRGASIANVTVDSHSGEPIARIARVAVGYNLPDFLSSRRLFGLTSLDVVNPEITVIHHRDGTYNIPTPTAKPQQGKSAPLRVAGTLQNGRGTLIDEAHGEATHLPIRDVNAQFVLDTASRSTYSATLAYVENARRYTISGNGDLNAPGGYMTQHWDVPAMPVARLLNVAVPANIMMRSGSISGAHVQIFGLPNARGVLRNEVAATTTLTGVRFTVEGLQRPVRDLGGRIDVSMAGLVFDGVRGTLAGVPVTATGGVYDFGNPRLRLALEARGELHQLRTAIAQASRLPIHGVVHGRVLAEGTPSSPFAIVRVDAPAVLYDRSMVRGTTGTVVYADNELDVLDVSSSYDGFSLEARGRIALVKRRNGIEVLAHAQGSSAAIPYASDLLSPMPLAGTVLATSSNQKLFDTVGSLRGRSATQQLAATFAVSSAGVGSIGPLAIDGSHGTLYAQARLDHTHNRHVGFLTAQNLWIPVLRGTFSGTAAMVFAGNRAVAQIDDGRFRDARLNGTSIQQVRGTVAFAPNDLRILAGDARISGSEALAAGTLANQNRVALSVGRFPVMNGAVDAGGFLKGNIASPSLRAALVAHNMHYQRLPLAGISSLDYKNGTLSLANTALGVGPAYIALDGTVSGLALGAPLLPRYDLDARVRAADISELVSVAQPAQGKFVTGSIDADAHVGGAGTQPAVAGTVRVPEGSVNGLSFRDLHVNVAGTTAAVALSGGGLTVGSTEVGFDGRVHAPNRIDLNVRASNIDLADFDDFFDAGEMLGGKGRIAASIAYAPGSLTSSGNAAFTATTFRRFNIGATNARWSTRGENIAIVANADAPSGRLSANGSVDPLVRNVNMTASVRRLDLNAWLPALGFTAPIRGLVDANASVAGRFPDVDSTVNAHADHGMLGKLVVNQVAIALRTSGGRGRIDRATIDAPYLSASASGTFGFHPNDQVDIVARASSSDIRALAHEATGIWYGIGGSVDTDATLTGTRLSPRIGDTVTVQGLRFRSYTLPRAFAQLVLTPNQFTVQHAEADLQHGRVVLAGDFPIQLTPPEVSNKQPFHASITADDVDLNNLASELPSDTKIGGRIDGTVRAQGLLDNPTFDGLLTLAQASYSGPQERDPISGSAQLAFFNRTVQLRNAVAMVGGGRVDAGGSVVIPSMRDLTKASFNMQVSANDVHVNAPKYYKGRIDADVAISRTPTDAVTLGGTVDLSSARVPLSAIYNPGTSNTPQKAPDIAFQAFDLVVGNDVRIQSPNVDVGGQGSMTLNGSLASLTPSGSFHSTGGTVSFYRTFTVDRANIAFSPDSGTVPDVNAVATTYITDPNTMIRLHVTGPATGMNLKLASQPSYSREQILGLLAGAQQLGAVQGVAATGGGSFSATGTATSLAEGQMNQVFARNLLEPLSTALSGTLGLSSVQFTNVVGQGFGASAAKAFGHNLDAVFAESFGYPKRTSFSLEATPSEATGIRAEIYTQSGMPLFATSQPPAEPPGVEPGYGAQQSIEPLAGSNGFDVKYERKFP